jgi:hypothetical protein
MQTVCPILRRTPKQCHAPDDASRPGTALNVIAGIWLIISPGVLSFSTMRVPMWNTLLVGIAVLILAAIRLGTVGTVGLSWINCLVGIWLLISTFVLSFTLASTAMGNAVILGVLVALFALWSTLVSVPTAAPPR